MRRFLALIAALALCFQPALAQQTSNGVGFPIAIAQGGTGATTLAGAGLPALITPCVVTAGAQTSVTFSSIPGTYTNLRLIETIKSASTSGTTDGLDYQVNGDTGTNYADVYVLGTGGSASSTGAFGQAQMFVGNVNDSNASDGNYAAGVVSDFPGYAQTTFNKAVDTVITNTAGGATTNAQMMIVGDFWANTAAITSIKVFLGSGSAFVNGSVLCLYGLP